LNWRDILSLTHVGDELAGNLSVVVKAARNRSHDERQKQGRFVDEPGQGEPDPDGKKSLK
jgi:hypothetical protein